MTNLLKFIFIVSIFFFTNEIVAQESRSLEKRKKELIQQEEQRKAEEAQALKDMQSGHMAIQTKDTRKRMKKSKKKANKVNKNKQGSFITRMFSKSF